MIPHPDDHADAYRRWEFAQTGDPNRYEIFTAGWKAKETASMDTFDRFCQDMENTLPPLYDTIRDHVAALMRAAGEDPRNKLMLATRTGQFTYSLNTRAEQELSHAVYEPSRKKPS